MLDMMLRNYPFRQFKNFIDFYQINLELFNFEYSSFTKDSSKGGSKKQLLIKFHFVQYSRLFS